MKPSKFILRERPVMRGGVWRRWVSKKTHWTSADGRIFMAAEMSPTHAYNTLWFIVRRVTHGLGFSRVQALIATVEVSPFAALLFERLNDADHVFVSPPSAEDIILSQALDAVRGGVDPISEGIRIRNRRGAAKVRSKRSKR